MLQIVALLSVLEDRLLGRLAKEETGGVVIEYGIVVAVIALGLATVGQGLVTAIGAWFTALAGRVAAL
ncbi:MAG: Flp family type IVb pilin [Actinomycetota bacterium]|nr:Flp family type IVb pilin [Actinomycetota bacterium]MDQ3530683.1 Flp family type IVb pilin [Actinomycetota bacterium]